MKLPSINYLVQESGKAFSRFPLTILCSLVSVVIGIYLVEFGKELEDDFVFYYTNSLLTFSLGISVFFCLSILAEKQKLGAKSNLFFQFLGILFLLGISNS